MITSTERIAGITLHNNEDKSDSFIGIVKWHGFLGEFAAVMIVKHHGMSFLPGFKHSQHVFGSPKITDQPLAEGETLDRIAPLPVRHSIRANRPIHEGLYRLLVSCNSARRVGGTDSVPRLGRSLLYGAS